MPKIRNIIIFIVIGAIFVLIYIFYIKKSPTDTASLISSTPDSAVSTSSGTIENNSKVAQDFLSLLLNVKSIKLDDTIFSDNAFESLHDSSITLTPDGNEGRPNPFAPLGTDIVAPPAASAPATTSTTTPSATPSTQVPPIP